ncbi:hypothetical protein JG687_00015561 [Phytophthora cactorum]|uniref:Uncharacterized protein n=1 Tax=Phytophthora cactorum TaxID=29920 RepID=A0A8T1TYH5_9STRA|nr:hypothetical protein JG687_00015561 [Phytophthora cactorum]
MFRCFSTVTALRTLTKRSSQTCYRLYLAGQQPKTSLAGVEDANSDRGGKSSGPRQNGVPDDEHQGLLDDDPYGGTAEDDPTSPLDVHGMDVLMIHRQRWVVRSHTCDRFCHMATHSTDRWLEAAMEASFTRKYKTVTAS